MIKKLTAKDVYKESELKRMNFKTSNDINWNINFESQKRAKETIRFGLAVNKYGYNIFCSGKPFSNRKKYLKEILLEFAKRKKIPNDLCFIYNFKEPAKPMLISLPHGKGHKFKEKMEEIKKIIQIDIKEIFKSTTYKKQIDFINNKYEIIINELYDFYQKKIEKYNYTFSEDEKGLITVPIKNGKIMTQEDINSMNKEEFFKFKKNQKKVIKIIAELTEKIAKLEHKKNQEIKNIDIKKITSKIDKKFVEIKKEFEQYDDNIKVYIDNLRKDLIRNIEKLKPNTQPNFDFTKIKNQDKDIINKYSVNLIVDNKDLKHAPIIFAEDITESNLFGSVKIELSEDVFKIDFTKIKVGNILKANGGYLIIEIEQLFKNPFIWDKLKNVIKYNKIPIFLKTYRDIFTNEPLFTIETDIDIKIILIGSIDWYYLLYYNDSEFRELFKIHAIFEEKINRNLEAEKEYAYFIKEYIEKNNLKPITKEALAFIIEYSSKLAESQDKLVLYYENIYKLLDEADAWAKINNKNLIDLETIKKTLEQQKYRINSYNEWYSELIKKNVVLINTTGKKIGEINGLTIIDFGDFSIGKPTKITANTYIGKNGVISIDRKVELSGKIHNKAVEIIRGYLGKLLTQDEPLSLTANLVFEQNYGKIDGDSATCAEIYAILSDLSGVAIKQSIAVTGSMNQKGEVQAVGGINEKIEGFFEICKIKGLTGEQGVIIPSSNIKDLMLSEEIRKAIKENKFKIYAIDRIEEGLEILTDTNFETICKIIFGNLNSKNKN